MPLPVKLKFVLSLIPLLGLLHQVSGQLTGKITDTNGVALPYATIYIEGTSTGTISNVEGEYELELKKNGQYQITYQYVGYKKETVLIENTGFPIHKDMVLEIDDNVIKELVISADREDPAYEIIRKAISKRKYYKNNIKSFEADLYVKGVAKINDAPKSILGEKIGDLNGILDTARQGIIYLSESKSKFYFMQPGQTKEIMISTVKSGDNSLLTANQFSWASFDLYSEYLNFSRSIVSPIASNAFLFYKFRLENTFIDKNGYSVNKIKIIPKSESQPLLKGYIYITDDLWNIYSTDIILAGGALKNTYLDTIAVRQVYIPVEKPDKWRLMSQIFSFKAGLLGFKMSGNFSYIFSNYILNKDISYLFNNSETFKVEPNALKRDSAFWNQTRPIPLTYEEQRDYIKKDSLQKIWNSKPYMDSTDKVNNKLTAFKFFTGFTHHNTYKRITWTYPSPLSTFRFNAVEGFKISLNIKWEKADTLLKKWSVEPVLEYGFSDKVIKPRIIAEYRFDNYNQGFVSFGVGRQNMQYEPRQPIAERGNTWASLWDKFNSIRLYQNNFIYFSYRKEVHNGLFIDFMTSYTDRRPLSVNTQYSFRKKNELYAENNPRPDLSDDVYRENIYWKNKLNILLRPAQKYSSYPNVKIRDVSDWPNIEMEYEAGIPLEKKSNLFHKLTLRVRDKYVNAKLLGYYSYNIEGGTSFNSNPSYFGDYFHPMGNEVLLPFSPDLSSFSLLPYYAFSTDKYYVQINFRHHFNGFIMDRIPLMNRTSLKTVIGFSALHEPHDGNYLELFAGIENFRIGPFQLFDIDYTWSFDDAGFRDHGITIRLSQLLNN